MQTLSVEKAAEHLQVSRRMIYYLIKAGRLTTKPLPIGQRIVVDELFLSAS